MSLPASQRETFTPLELEFMAEEEHVQIVPLISMSAFEILSGKYGPFRPPLKAEVPLWLAVNMKQQGKCRIVPPDWMSVENLQMMANLETSNAEISEMPFRYLEIARVIFNAASDDLQSASQTRSLIKDISDARKAKAREGLKAMDDDLVMGHISQMEINELRTFFANAWSKLGETNPANMKNNDEEDGDSDNSMS